LERASRVFEKRITGGISVKPIQECLAQGDRSLSEDEELALLHALESAFAVLYREGKLAADLPCAAALEKLDRDLTGDLGGDETTRFARERLGEFLNLNEGRYFRANIRWDCRKIGKSVERHREPNRPDAYLDFINHFIE
jgi:hypothetical protein